MRISLTKGTGSGPTTLAAFDNSLYMAGIANYNLLRLSSVIPPGTEIAIDPDGQSRTLPGNWGDRLYVVMAELSTELVGQEVWAGIGWVQDPVTQKGLFVEHEGHSESGVRNDITASLNALMKTRGIDFGEIQMVVNGVKCQGEAVNAMVVATYQVSDWENKASVLAKEMSYA